MVAVTTSQLLVRIVDSTWLRSCWAALKFQVLAPESARKWLSSPQCLQAQESLLSRAQSAGAASGSAMRVRKCAMQAPRNFATAGARVSGSGARGLPFR